MSLVLLIRYVQTNLACKLSYKNFEINSILSNVTQSHTKSLFSFPNSDLTIDRQFIDIGYKHDFNENWNVSLNATYNGHEGAFAPANGSYHKAPSAGYLFELTTYGKLYDDINLVSGVIFEEMEGEFKVNSDVEYSAWRRGIYAQLDYQIFDWLQLTAGMQINEPEESKKSYSPRVGAVMNLNENWGAKFLYGEAFRSPFGLGLFIDVPTLQGNANLKPETIKTYDAQIFYHTPLYNAAVYVVRVFWTS